MIKIGDSVCHCGFCATVFDVEWEVETTDSYERGMGEEVEYVCVAETECPECGREIVGHMSIYEYPIGTLNMVSEIETDDGETEIAKPRVYFFDL